MVKKSLFLIFLLGLFFAISAGNGAEAAQKCLTGDGLKYTIPGEWYVKMTQGKINLETALQYSKKEAVKKVEICFNPKWGGVKVDLGEKTVKFDADTLHLPSTRSIPIVSLFIGFWDAYSKLEYFAKNTDEAGKVMGVSNVGWDGKDANENEKIDMIRFQIKDIKYGSAKPKNLGLEWVGYPEFVEWYVGNVMTDELKVALGRKKEPEKEISLGKLNEQLKALDSIKNTTNEK